MGFVWQGNYVNEERTETSWDLKDPQGKILGSFTTKQKEAVDRLISNIGIGGSISTKWPSMAR